jgi:diaminopimelate epimerase
MNLNFFKYQGTGNDFIIIDNRNNVFEKKDAVLIAKLCDRRFGIGADGLMLLQNYKDYDFEMVYFNSDGNQSSMCGNGGRCISAFAKNLGIISTNARFMAIDGPHEAVIGGAIQNNSLVVKLKMQDVNEIEQTPEYLFLNTGSPHYVKKLDNITTLDVIGEARKIRYNERFKSEGTNVNFIEEKNGVIYIRTYERGVENETLSCGTGSTAAAIAADHIGLINTANYCRINTLGGKLTVYFEKNGSGYKNIWLEGPTTFVFKGEINV